MDAVDELIGLINGYSYTNENPINMTDPSGMIAQPMQWQNLPNTVESSEKFLQFSLSNNRQLAIGLNGAKCNFSLVMSPPAEVDPRNYCDRRKNDIIQTLREIARRVDELTADFCELWELSQGYSIVPRPECKNAGTWESHLETLRQKKNRLDNLYGGFDTNNCPDPDNEVRDTVNEWSSLDTDSLLPRRETERRGIPQPIPPYPNLAYVEACIGIQIFGRCIPIFFLPL